jgi:hypothetical protein
MYTGTLISDLMAAVERAEWRAQQKSRKRETREEIELRMLEAMYGQLPQTQTMAGAA